MQDDQTPQWQYSAGDQNGDNQVTEATESNETAVSWTASEFIAHAKSGGWYILLALVSVVLAVLAYLMTKGDKLTPIGILIAGILFGVMAARQPRELPYTINSRGIQIGNKSYPYSGFKSFSVVLEDNIEAIWLIPLQRYMPGLSIYFSPEDKDKILDILDNHLPVEPREPDFVDRFMHKVRF